MEVEQSTEAVDQVASIPDDVVIRILSSLKVRLPHMLLCAAPYTTAKGFFAPLVHSLSNPVQVERERNASMMHAL